jgi:hypothetical protein
MYQCWRVSLQLAANAVITTFNNVARKLNGHWLVFFCEVELLKVKEGFGRERFELLGWRSLCVETVQSSTGVTLSGRRDTLGAEAT